MNMFLMFFAGMVAGGGLAVALIYFWPYKDGQITPAGRFRILGRIDGHQMRFRTASGWTFVHSFDPATGKLIDVVEATHADGRQWEPEGEETK